MNKPLMIFVMIALVVGGGLYANQILALFHGMSPLESLRFIWQFVLHVAVITIVVYLIQTLPEFVKPWSKALGLKWRLRLRQVRRGRGADVQKTPRAKPLSTDQLMRMYIAKQMSGGVKTTKSEPMREENDIRF